MKQKRIEEIVCLIGIALIAIWVGILCFYHLGEAGTHNTDEARHIANAYEMFKITISGLILIDRRRITLIISRRSACGASC